MPILNDKQQAYLRNPFYSALTMAQAILAEHIGNTIRYSPSILPFAAIPTTKTVIDAASLRRDTDTNFIGILPHIEADTPGAFLGSCLQMAWQPHRTFTVPDALSNEVELGATEAEDMVVLTQVAFPGYFRAETYKLGRYIGLRIEGELVAMAGHRTRMPGLREISAVCTRPGHTGKGYAQHLIQRLLAHMLTDNPGELPYLHTVSTNTRAIDIYHHLGFITTGEVPFLKLPQQP